MAAKLKLTKASVEKCAVGADRRQVIFWDTEMRGFGLRVGPNTKTYIFQRDLPGRRTRRMTIGRHPTWSPEEARKEARSLAVRVDKGEDPAVTKRARAARGVTLRQALEMHLTRLRAKDASPRTIETLTYEIPRYLGDWLDRPLAEISRDECRRRHHRLTERSGIYAANRALRHLRTLYNTAARVHDLPGRAPTVAVDWNKQRRRREPITWTELPLWHERLLELSPVRRDYHLFVLLTGLRATDAATVRWEHVDLDAATVHRPKPKGGVDRAFTVPLSKRCIELLRARRAESAVEFGPLGGTTAGCSRASRCATTAASSRGYRSRTSTARFARPGRSRGAFAGCRRRTGFATPTRARRTSRACRCSTSRCS